MLKKILFATTALAFVWGAMPATPAQAADAKFVVTSSALKTGGYLPKKYAGNNPASKNCDGQGVSFPLAWKNAPANTKSFAITMVDLAGRNGLGVIHWVAYGIPASKTSLKEGEASQPSKDIVGGKNMPGTTVYYGPCPPFTDAPHPYTVIVIATDLAPDALQPGMTYSDLITALNGHALDSAPFVANYRK
jgi:Raf kinase inhibitor-like YbhB/YbcL family protein